MSAGRLAFSSLGSLSPERPLQPTPWSLWPPRRSLRSCACVRSKKTRWGGLPPALCFRLLLRHQDPAFSMVACRRTEGGFCREASPTGLRPPPVQLTMLQKAVQQTAAQGSDGGGLTPLESQRSSAAGSLVTPPTDRSLQAASQHGGLTRAADCFRYAVPQRRHAAVLAAALTGTMRAVAACR